MGERIVFTIAAAAAIAFAIQVVTFKEPFRATVSLIGTLLAIAVLFVLLSAPFVAAIQVIVYAGAIVVLFLFVLMLLGVDQAEDLSVDPLVGQRPLAAIVGVAGAALLLVAIFVGDTPAPGAKAATEAISDTVANINQLGTVLFTDYVLAFEITAILLTIAVVGAVALSRRADDDAADSEEVS